MLWVSDERADRRIREMLSSYAKHQGSGCSCHFHLLEFIGMTAEEFEMWTAYGLVSDRNLRCMDIDATSHRGEWLTSDRARLAPRVGTEWRPGRAERQGT